MIVNHTDKGYDIITHYAHGLQTAQIGQYLKMDYRPKYWLSTLCAMIEHDDEQLNFENDNNVSENGIPLDFEKIDVDLDDVLERCKRVMVQSRTRSQWVALIIAHHLEFLYKDLSDQNDKLGDFFVELHDLKIRFRKSYKIKAEESLKYYQLLKFCDRCSLILSKNEVPSGGRKLEINSSIDGFKYFIYNSKGTNHIEPWPFIKDEFSIFTEVYSFEELQFNSSTELKKKIFTKSPLIREFKLSRD